MHISEGILSAPVLVTGAGLTVTAVGYSLKKMEHKEVPKVAILSSGFFVACLIHLPVGPSGIHLILNGVIGVLLGWSAFPAILVALALQGVLFQFGGITTLGINTFNMALPAVICFYLFNRGIKGKNNFIALTLAFVCGSLAVLLSGIMLAAALVFIGEPFLQVAKLVLISHLPVMILEGVLAVFCIGFLRKVRPEILDI